MANEFLSPYATSKVLEGVLAALPKIRGNFLQSNLASGFITRNTKTINFDQEFATKNATAIFVAERADVTPIQLGDFGHKELYFAYSKEGWADDEFDVLDQRQLGQQLGQAQNIMANNAARLIQKAAIAEQRFENLFEKTWAEVLMFGGYEAFSEKHPRMRYNFGRNKTTTFAGWANALVSSINLTLTDVVAPWDATEVVLPIVPTTGGVTSGSKAWTKALVTAGTATPVKDLVKMYEASARWGAPISRFIMQDSAYEAFNFDVETNYATGADITITTILSAQRDIIPQAQEVDGLTYKRSWSLSNGISIPIYTYNAKYNDRNTGAETQFVPDGWVLGIPAASYGVKAYGRIKHPRANYAAMPRFINRWMTEKDAVNEYEEHTSFLIGHTKINACTAWKVV